jgi:RNA polymerase-interacting CarD/CdnL/TRCF family regulator
LIGDVSGNRAARGKIVQRKISDIYRELHWVEAQLAANAKGKTALKKYQRTLYRELTNA